MKIRNVVPEDRQKVFKIVENIWGGTDYIPLVFDEWIKDRIGRFFAAVDEKGRLVGFEKLTMVTPEDAWIEGLRKDFDSGVKGVGKFLTGHILAFLADNINIRSVRFATYYTNIESITLFGKMGFKVLEKRDHKFLKLSKVNSIPKYKGNRASFTNDVNAVVEFVDRSEWKKKNKNGIVIRGWSNLSTGKI